MMTNTGTYIHAVLPNDSHHDKPNFELKVAQYPFSISLGFNEESSGMHQPNLEKIAFCFLTQPSWANKQKPNWANKQKPIETHLPIKYL